MDKTIRLASIMPLLTVAPAIPMAPAQANPGVVNFCKTEILPTVPTANLGECVLHELQRKGSRPTTVTLSWRTIRTSFLISSPSPTVCAGHTSK